MVRFGTSRSAAETALKLALSERTTTAFGEGELTRESRVSDLAQMWLLGVLESHLAKSTKARYQVIANTFVTHGVGQLRLRELDVRAADRFLRSVKTNHGAATAKGVRSVLSGMIGLAMRYGAMSSNPLRDVSPISAPPKTVARALTPQENKDLLTKLHAGEQAAVLDLVDLVDFMSGTGCRIGEACALREPQVDLVNGVVEITGR